MTAVPSFLDAFKGLCYGPDMQKVRQPVGMALMILVFPAAIYGAFPWGIAGGLFVSCWGWPWRSARFSAIVWSWCLFSGDLSGRAFYLDVESGLFFQPPV